MPNLRTLSLLFGPFFIFVQIAHHHYYLFSHKFAHKSVDKFEEKIIMYYITSIKADKFMHGEWIMEENLSFMPVNSVSSKMQWWHLVSCFSICTLSLLLRVVTIINFCVILYTVTIITCRYTITIIRDTRVYHNQVAMCVLKCQLSTDFMQCFASYVNH